MAAKLISILQNVSINQHVNNKKTRRKSPLRLEFSFALLEAATADHRRIKAAT